MSEWFVFLLPPAIAFAGMRILRLLLGPTSQLHWGLGFSFAVGLGIGMLVFTQAALAGALIGINLAKWLAWTALLWGAVEFVLLAWRGAGKARQFRFQKAHLWLLLLSPLVYYFWIFARLSVLEGTMEFDAAVHWLMKSKILYLKQGQEFIQLMHNPNLAYVHWDYPLLVPALYALNYGALGAVNEFANKVWPFWMVLSLCLAILSVGNIWKRPHPLPIIVATVICFLPATLRFIHWEGGTIPMLFYASLTALLIVRAVSEKDVPAFATFVMLLAGCAMTKFEGILYAGAWMLALLPIVWRHHWLRQPIVAKAAAFALICLLPYVMFRLNRPICHIESGWPKTVLETPGMVWQNFPKIMGLSVVNRFFSAGFSDWTATADGKLQWIGIWTGWDALKNHHLHILPWLTLLLLIYSLWQRRHRQAVVLLTLVVMGVFAFLALVISCLPQLRDGNAAIIASTASEGMGRYYYPFFLAWFLGMVSVWLPAAETVIPQTKPA